MVKKGLILTFALGLIALSPAPSWSHSHMHHGGQAAQTKDDITLVVHLTKDKAPSAVMAIRFATVSLGRGNPTVIWLTSEGVRLADAKAKPSRATSMLKEFISKGGKVYVCPHCAQMLGVKTMIEGAEVGQADIVFGLLSEERVRVVTW